MSDANHENPFAAPEAELEPEASNPLPDIPSAEDETLPPPLEPLVEIASFAQLIEAEVTRGQLVSAGIRAALRDQHTVGAHPMLGVAVGGVKVVVSENDLERAKEVLTLASGSKHRAFRVEQSSSLIYALLGGAVGAIIGGFLRVVLGTWILSVAGFAGLIVGALLGRSTLAYCSRCSSTLTPEIQSCPGCDAQIVGVIDDPEDRLAAEERLKDAD